MKLGMHQPNFMPWAGFFHRMQIVDLFILMDQVEYTERSIINRVKIRTKEGWQWLTIPVLTKGRFHQPINEVEINQTIRWQSIILRSIELNYRKAAYWNLYGDKLKEVFSKKWTKLFDLNLAIIEVLRGWLGITTEMKFLSSIPSEGQKTELLVNVARSVNADVFLTGEGSRDYIDSSIFQSAGIQLKFPNFQFPKYQQCYQGFESGVSVIDTLMCCGPESMKVVMNAQSNKDLLG